MSNREELTRQAEKHLRLGRVDDAIALYQELAYLSPVDWGLVKQLADLLERAGQREGAARQFTRWADYLFAEGFHSKAAALYKKILKLEGADEHALWQLGEVSIALKLRADARIAFQRVLEIRQRRGDTAGAGVARERLASLDAMAASAAPAPGLARWSAPAEAAAATPSREVPAPAGRAEASALTVAAAVMPVARDTPPVIAPAPAPVATFVPATSTLDTLASAPTVPATPPAPERVLPVQSPADTADARLARLRRDAQLADARQAPDADTYWAAVLQADPSDADLRVRLVQAAAARGDAAAARQLATGLDPARLPAFVVLVELAYRQRRADLIEHLVSERIQDGAGDTVLAALDQLATHDEGAARAALTAAVAVWTAQGRGASAAAAMEQAAAHGWLTTVLCLRWVEICLDNHLPALSTAQSALARAYVAEGRLSEARTIAEDIFVRDLGVEPSHSLLLEVLERQGVVDTTRVLADLLAPPPTSSPESEPVGTGGGGAGAHGFDQSWSHDVQDSAVADLTVVDDSPRFDAPSPQPHPPLTHVAAASAAPAEEADAALTSAEPTFDWADLLGRDVAALHGVSPKVAGPAMPIPEAAMEPELAEEVQASTGEEPAGPAAVDVDQESADISPSLLAGEPELPIVGVDAPVAELVDERPVADDNPVTEDKTEEPSSAPPASPATVVPAPFAAGSTAPRIGDLRGQPFFAEEAPLQPSFSMPSSWLTATPEPLPDDAPRRRAPGDDFFFDDDATLPRWATQRQPSAQTSLTESPTTPDSVADQPLAADDGAAEARDVLVAVEAASFGVIEEQAPVAVADDTAASGLARDFIDGTKTLSVDHDTQTVQAADAASPAAAGQPPGGSDDDEEVDLTELLEALKQWDPELPELRRDRPAETSASAGARTPLAPVVPLEAVAEAIAAVASEPESEPQPEPEEVGVGDVLPEPTPLADDAGRAELDAAFADLQRHGDERTVAEQQLAAGRVFLAAGLASEAARAFERASVEPRARFEASLALGELHKSRGQLLDAIGWFEQAAMAPVPDAAVKRPVLYDLAESLEALGEHDRALGVLLDLLSQVEDYRDARARLDRLLRVDAGG